MKDTTSSASRQHYIDTGEYLPLAYRVGWICECCLMVHANGDSTACVDYHGHVVPTDHPSEPASLLGEATLGLGDEEHECGIPWEDRIGECGCETRDTSWYAHTCDGCDARMAAFATMHAVTIWG